MYISFIILFFILLSGIHGQLLPTRSLSTLSSSRELLTFTVEKHGHFSSFEQHTCRISEDTDYAGTQRYFEAI